MSQNQYVNVQHFAIRPEHAVEAFVVNANMPKLTLSPHAVGYAWAGLWAHVMRAASTSVPDIADSGRARHFMEGCHWDAPCARNQTAHPDADAKRYDRDGDRASRHLHFAYWLSPSIWRYLHTHRARSSPPTGLPTCWAERVDAVSPSSMAAACAIWMLGSTNPTLDMSRSTTSRVVRFHSIHG